MLTATARPQWRDDSDTILWWRWWRAHRVLAHLRRNTPDGGRSQHLTTDVVVELDENRATVRFRTG